MKEEGFSGPPPTFWNGHIIIFLPMEVFPIQVKWRGEEGPEGLLQVANCSLEKPFLYQVAQNDVENGYCDGSEDKYCMTINEPLILNQVVCCNDGCKYYHTSSENGNYHVETNQ